MPEQQEELTRLQRQMAKQAIDLAMQNRWKEAIVVNQSIIEGLPTDVDAYNRLGKAFMELGELTKAREAYNKALELGPNNSIAKKNLDRIAKLRKARATVSDERRRVPPDLFIGEVGKAGVVNLINVASASVLARMAAGDQVYLKASGPHLIVENEAGDNLGQVEMPHSFRLNKLMEGGNEYTAAIVSVDDSSLRVIIRETHQHPSQLGRLSFPPKSPPDGFQTHVKDSLLRSDSEEEYLEELEEAEEGGLEEGELIPEGFSIFEEGTPIEGEPVAEDLIEGE
jgi:hypothetical protein